MLRESPCLVSCHLLQRLHQLQLQLQLQLSRLTVLPEGLLARQVALEWAPRAFGHIQTRVPMRVPERVPKRQPPL